MPPSAYRYRDTCRQTASEGVQAVSKLAESTYAKAVWTFETLVFPYIGSRPIAKLGRPELWGQYGDCFSVQVNRVVTLAQWVFAFYTSPVFRLERVILHVLARAPSNDQQAQDVAQGRRETFAVWVVGARTTDQLLMCDRYGKTRSWFRVTPQESGGTVLQFGSAVAARRGSQGGTHMSGGFSVLLGLHKIYSKLLIGAAKHALCQGIT